MPRLHLAPTLLGALLATACAPDAPAPLLPSPPDAAVAAGHDSKDEHLALQRIRAATARFHSLEQAKAAGYTVWSPDPTVAGSTCPSSPLGQMGYHLVNVPLRGQASDPANGDVTIDLEHPEMLLYEKGPNGTLHLVGVEYLVFKAAWEAAYGVGAAPPEVLGHPLLPSSHSFVAGGPSIPHYELHVWIWKANPLGMFEPWNPDVTC